MGVYKVTCHSKCGTYFVPYLQSITVVANDVEDAKRRAKKWLKIQGRDLLYPETEWKVYLLRNVAEGVIDYHYAADY